MPPGAEGWLSMVAISVPPPAAIGLTLVFARSISRFIFLFIQSPPFTFNPYAVPVGVSNDPISISCPSCASALILAGSSSFAENAVVSAS